MFTKTGTEPVVTAIVTTVTAVQALPAESTRKTASGTEFLLAIDDSQVKILNQIETINAELVKDSTTGFPSQDYTALGSYETQACCIY